MKFVKVEWIDATTLDYTEVIDIVKEAEPINAISVGFLIEDTKDKIIIGLIKFYRTDEAHDSIKYSQIIPKCLVKKITELKEV